MLLLTKESSQESIRTITFKKFKYKVMAIDLALPESLSQGKV